MGAMRCRFDDGDDDDDRLARRNPDDALVQTCTHVRLVSTLYDVQMLLDRPKLDAPFEDDDVLVLNDLAIRGQGGEVRGGRRECGDDGQESREGGKDGELHCGVMGVRVCLCQMCKCESKCDDLMRCTRCPFDLDLDLFWDDESSDLEVAISRKQIVSHAGSHGCKPASGNTVISER